MQETRPEKESTHHRGIGHTTGSSGLWRGKREGGRRFHSLQMEPLAPNRESTQKAFETSSARAGGILDHIKGAKVSIFLLAVQIAALAAFFLILSSYYSRLHILDGDMTAAAPQSAAAAATAIETPTAVASITPTSRDRYRLTRAKAVRQKEEPTPLPGTTPPERLVIPSIDVDAPIVQGDTEKDFEKGVGHRPGSANPGARGNMILSAHNDIHGEIFRDLQLLKTGDDVYVHTDARVFHYVVQSMQIVPPTKVEFMGSTDDARLTMITCHPYLLNTHRVVSVAHLVE